MANITKKTAVALKKLLSEGCVSAASAGSGTLFINLLHAGAVRQTRKGKGRYNYCLVNEEQVRILCRAYDSRLTDIEAYLRSLESTEMTPAEQAKAFSGNDKYRKRNLWKGFFLKSNHPAEVTYRNKTVTIDEDHPLLVEEPASLEIHDGDIVIVENYQCFRSLSWISEVLPSGQYFVMCRWPQTSSQRKYLKSIPNRKLYFGDIDLAGINIYLTEYADVVPSVNYIIPDDHEERISQGSHDLYVKQERKFGHISSNDERIQKLIRTIKDKQKGYIQEIYIHD